MCTGNGYGDSLMIGPLAARLMRYLLRIRYTCKNSSGMSSIRLIARPSVDKIGDPEAIWQRIVLLGKQYLR